MLVPASLDELLASVAADTRADLIAGGTDLMVEVNFGRRSPESVISVALVPELKSWYRSGDEVILNAALTYSEMMRPPLCELLPALAQAARTVGSPQIRNAGTIGGNLATASPAGDTLPVLAALEATVVLESAEGGRAVPVGEFIVSVKRTSLAPGEIIRSVRVPARRAAQEFLKVGTRNAMVIAVCSVALVADAERREVHLGLGSVGPVPLRAPRAEELATSLFDWDEGVPRASEKELARLAELASEAARPIDDHRSTARYRRHAVGVCARRAFERARLPDATGRRSVTP